MLATRLRKLGATVLFVRNSTQPVTSKRPADFKELARKILIKNGVPRPRDEVLESERPGKRRHDQLAKRNPVLSLQRNPASRGAGEHEAASRSRSLSSFQCRRLGRSGNPTLIDNNHLHLLVNGSYLQDELDFDDERFEMIRRLLSRAYDEELPMADTVAASMAKETRLASLSISDDDDDDQSWIERLRLRAQSARHPDLSLSGRLLRTLRHEQQRRLRSNSGRRLRRHAEINGVERKSIFREYADSVAEGLVEYYSKARDL